MPTELYHEIECIERKDKDGTHYLILTKSHNSCDGLYDLIEDFGLEYNKSKNIKMTLQRSRFSYDQIVIKVDD